METATGKEQRDRGLVPQQTPSACCSWWWGSAAHTVLCWVPWKCRTPEEAFDVAAGNMVGFFFPKLAAQNHAESAIL